MRIIGNRKGELHKKKYWKIWKVGIFWQRRSTGKIGKWEFLFHFFLQKTLFCFLFVFARLTITSLIYYKLIQDHNCEQNTSVFGFFSSFCQAHFCHSWDKDWLHWGGYGLQSFAGE